MKKPQILKQGFAILLVLMFLLLLYTLGVAFLMVTIIQWEIMEAWYDDVRAREIAESGVYEAIERLYFTFPMQVSRPEVPCIWRYWGDNLTEDELKEEENFVLTEYAQNPSFAWEEDEDPYNDNLKPKLINVSFPWGVRKNIGVSGFSPRKLGRYAIHGEVFNLKVIDTSAQLYINEGLGHPYNSAVMRRMLNVLGMYLNWGHGWDEVPENLGDIIIKNRPPEGYRYKQELLEFLPWKSYMRVKHFICANTWVDTKVCNPVPLSMDVEDVYRFGFDDEPDPTWLYQIRPRFDDELITRYGRGKGCDGNLLSIPFVFYDGSKTEENKYHSSIYGHDELNPCWVEITSRAPVNINTAPRAILVAVLSYLEGFFTSGFGMTNGPIFYCYYGDEVSYYHWGKYYGLKRVYRTLPIGGPASSGLYNSAVDIAEKILLRRKTRPFDSWEDFERFLKALVGDLIFDWRKCGSGEFFEYVYGSGGQEHRQRLASEAIADVILSNADPNLHLNEINPDGNLYRWVDKTDLIRNSTEFCFLPTGVFEIESQGLVLKPQEGYFDALTAPVNIVRGRRKVITEVKIYDIYRETTQRDFFRGSFDSASDTNNLKTLQSAPEPDNGLAPYENEYEGYILLSTYGGCQTVHPKGIAVNTPTVVSCPLDYDSTMHAHYDFDFRLHQSTSGMTKPLNEKKVEGWEVDSFTDHDRTEENFKGEFAPPYCLVYKQNRYRIARSYRLEGEEGPSLRLFAPTDHRIDGVYCERHAYLAYYSAGPDLSKPYHKAAISIYNGTISYWIKPNFLPELSTQGRVFVELFPPEDVEYATLRDGIFVNYSVDSRNENKSLSSHSHLSSFMHQLRKCSLGFMFRGQESRYLLKKKVFKWYEMEDFFTIKEYSHAHVSPDKLEFVRNASYIFQVDTPTLRHTGASCYPTLHSSLMDRYAPHRWMHVAFSWGYDEEINISFDRVYFADGECVGYPPGTCPLHPDKDTECPCHTTEDVRWCWPKGEVGVRDGEDGLHPYKKSPAEDYPEDSGFFDDKRYCNIIVDGKVVDEPYPTYHFWEPFNGKLEETYHKEDPFSILYTPWHTNLIYVNPLRFGGMIRRSSANATLDELYVWDRRLDEGVEDEIRSTIWGKGRYYRGEGKFTSGEIDFGKISDLGRSPADPSLEPYPDGTGRVGAELTLQEANPRILGISWTTYTEDLYDYFPLGTIGEPFRVDAGCELFLQVYEDDKWQYINNFETIEVKGGGKPYTYTIAMPMTKCGWTWVEREIRPYEGKWRVRYIFRLYVDGDLLNMVLLESPIFDDISIYYRSGVIFLTWILA